MATSYTGTIGTNDEFVSLATESGVTFTSGKSYTIQIQNIADIKLGDAVFTVYTDNPFTYTASSDVLYINTHKNACSVSILEGN